MYSGTSCETTAHQQKQAALAMRAWGVRTHLLQLGNIVSGLPNEALNAMVWNFDCMSIQSTCTNLVCTNAIQERRRKVLEPICLRSVCVCGMTITLCLSQVQTLRHQTVLCTHSHAHSFDPANQTMLTTISHRSHDINNNNMSACAVAKGGVLGDVFLAFGVS